MIAKYKEKIGVIGLGKLGLPMLSAFIKRGFDTFGFDNNRDLISILKKKINPYNEEGIQEVINEDEFWGSRFYDDLNEFLTYVNTIFIIVPTPTKNFIFDTSIIESLIRLIDSKIIDSNLKNISLVITSTVNPGDCNKFSAKCNSKRLKIVYSPEFIALGSVLNDMLHPDVVLLGGEDEEAIDKIFSIYNKLYLSFPEYHRLTFFEAETAKIGINTFVTTKISYANTLGMFIENNGFSSESAQKVLNAIGGDSRIGRKYFNYGVGYGGPCFPRDNRALGWHLEQSNVPAFIPNSTDKLNDYLIDFWKNKIKKGNYDAVVVIGIAYKKNTDFLEESFMIKLLNALKITCFYYDDLVKNINNLNTITKSNHLDLLKKYNKIAVLINYGEFIFDESLNNLDIIKIWA